MCGIVGYVGAKQGGSIVLSGLRKLEYRGYDSAGIASLVSKGRSVAIELRRSEGRLDNLAKVIVKKPLTGTVSIGHTRWATHGKPSERNAHPHQYKDVVIVHNGIIENYQSLRQTLAKKGHKFTTETDSEVIAHALHSLLQEGISFKEACLKLVNTLKGAFAIVAMWTKEPEQIFIAKEQCPIVIGVGEKENFVASDIAALIEYTKKFIFLNDQEMAFIEPSRFEIQTFEGKTIHREIKEINWSLAVAEKGGFDHFMLKEIHEQPHVFRDTVSGRLQAGKSLVFEGIKFKENAWKKFKAAKMLACGTAWHAGLVGRYWMESFSKIPVDVELASEFRYRDPVVAKDSLCIAISQSGETADTIAAIQEATRRKGLALSVTNTVESSIVRTTKNVIYTHAGPEISVASTKCFTAQMTVLYLLALKLGQSKGTLSPKLFDSKVKEFLSLPEKMKQVIDQANTVKAVAERFKKFSSYFYLGRGISNAIALEGALKLKEIAYINTQAYPAGEMKHGPIALISPEWAVVCVAPKGPYQAKMISNMQEVKARGGRLIVIGTEGDKETKEIADAWISIPEVSEEVSPFLSVIVLQLFSYYMSVLRGCDVDKPRNLAKSVTVE